MSGDAYNTFPSRDTLHHLHDAWLRSEGLRMTSQFQSIAIVRQNQNKVHLRDKSADGNRYMKAIKSNL